MSVPVDFAFSQCTAYWQQTAVFLAYEDDQAIEGVFCWTRTPQMEGAQDDTPRTLS